jgi:hypothetical protein
MYNMDVGSNQRWHLTQLWKCNGVRMHLYAYLEMLPTCQPHVIPTQDITPILARWVHVANTKMIMLAPVGVSL